MIVRATIPAPPLCDFVELLWYQEGAPPAHRQERLLPQGTVELVVDLWNDEPGCVVCGPHSEPKRHREHCERAQVWAAHPWVIDGVLVYVDAVDKHYARACAAGATILSELEDGGPGRRYRAEDLEGHRWMFMQRTGERRDEHGR